MLELVNSTLLVFTFRGVCCGCCPRHGCHCIPGSGWLIPQHGTGVPRGGMCATVTGDALDILLGELSEGRQPLHTMGPTSALCANLIPKATCSVKVVTSLSLTATYKDALLWADVLWPPFRESKLRAICINVAILCAAAAPELMICGAQTQLHSECENISHMACDPCHWGLVPALALWAMGHGPWAFTGCSCKMQDTYLRARSQSERVAVEMLPSSRKPRLDREG